MIRKPQPEPVEDAPLCGVRGDNIRVTCMLPKGHVRTLDDWHEATGEASSHVKTNIFEQTATTREHFRWIPSVFELPKDQMAKALDVLRRGDET